MSKPYIYITRHIKSGRGYVGSHNGKKNWYLGSGILILKAIKKYGTKSFKREILEECKTIEETRLLEEKYIKKFNTLYPFGYNLSPKGGLSIYGCHNEETKIKIGNANRGRKRSEKCRKIMKQKAKGRRNNYKPISKLEAQTIIYLHLIFNQTVYKIDKKINIHIGRIKRFLTKYNIYVPKIQII